MHYEYLDGALKMVKKLSVELWTLNDRHLGSVAEGEGPLFKMATFQQDVVTTVNKCMLYKCNVLFLH